MRVLARLFRDHPESVGESYFEHLRTAAGFSLRMIGGGLACLVHGLLPFLFVKTGSRQIEHLHSAMVANRSRRCTSDPAGRSRLSA